ncbi:MAG: hydroxyacylglutathione hydrolase [bacterium ADurb.Bin236]|nr:MAG: hydroxyacylglutathione hydrolase [bacterium ADurb.Bin236]HOY64695.1 MBL fold metallo-hydrolase [bacterium]
MLVKVFNVTERSKIYTSNSYLVLGEWNTLHDLNTLVDVGSDPVVIDWIRNVYTGVGKKPVERVILTHNHMDHNGALGAIKREFDPEVFAFSPGAGVDRLVKNGDRIRAGDDTFEVIHFPQHSSDSICLYCRSARILFVGDSHVIVTGDDTSGSEPFTDILIKLSALPIDSIYFGHGAPILEGGDEAIRSSLSNIARNRSRKKK